MVTLCSIFRNSAHYLERYFNQVDDLRKKIDVRVIGVWGDSTDDTYEMLKHYRGMELGEYHHGGQHYGSVDYGPRWDQIAGVVRFALRKVEDPGDALIWVESDLIWEPSTMLGLIKDLDRVPAVAPMVFGPVPDITVFYDTWGFRQHGQQFHRNYPYYFEGRSAETGLVKIDSCGSCFVTREDAWKTWTGHWPYPAGGNLWLDPELAVTHP